MNLSRGKCDEICRSGAETTTQRVGGLSPSVDVPVNEVSSMSTWMLFGRLACRKGRRVVLFLR
jgi:hypothetical protein